MHPLSSDATDLRDGPGWIVTYVVDLRGGGPSSGYISSGFFGGTQSSSIASVHAARTH